MTVILGSITILLTLLAALLALSAAVFALAAILSFSIAWYERVNSDPTVAIQRRHALALKLIFTEFTVLVLALLLRPLGWLPSRIRLGAARRPPVILLHGLFQNRSCLLPLKWRLQAAGFDRVISVNTPSWLDLETLTARVDQTVTAVLTASGAQQVHLVGHSMGGIIARNYLQQHNHARQVAACVTLGSPHYGSKLAPFAVSRLGRLLLPNSQFLTSLNAAALPAGVRFTAIYSRHDNMIVPMEYARLDGANNVELNELGHMAMLFSGKMAGAVINALTSSDKESVTKKP